MIEVGKKVAENFEVIRKAPGIDGRYGAQTIYFLRGPKGLKYEWHAAPGSAQLTPGERVNLTGKVKDIDADRILLTNCRKF